MSSTTYEKLRQGAFFFYTLDSCVLSLLPGHAKSDAHTPELIAGVGEKGLRASQGEKHNSNGCVRIRTYPTDTARKAQASQAPMVSYSHLTLPRSFGFASAAGK